MDYLRMNLELSPIEYMGTSRDLFETAMAYQCARADGINLARQQDSQRKASQAQHNAAVARNSGR